MLKFLIVVVAAAWIATLGLPSIPLVMLLAVAYYVAVRIDHLPH